MRLLSLRKPVLLAAAALITLGSLLVYDMVETAQQRVAIERAIRYSDQVIGDLQSLRLEITTAESAARGYLLTGDPQHLQIFDSAIASLAVIGQRLHAALSSQADERLELVRLDQLDRLAASKLVAMHQAVDLQRAGRSAEAMAVSKEGVGLNLMRNLRAAVDGMIADANQGLEFRRQVQQRQQEVAAGVMIGGAAFAALMMLAGGILAMLYARAHDNTQRALQVAHDAAVNADRAKSQFLATASHDLRQPLHAMNLFISALRRRVSGDEARQLVANMASAAESMQLMFSSLLDVSKLHAGVVVPATEYFSLEQVLAHLRTAFAGPAAAKGLNLVIPPTTVAVHSDPVLLESILRNLLSNAVRYTRQGEVSLHCIEQDKRLFIEVHDTGPGIPADQIERAFEEFRRLDTPDATERGLGLGLAIVRRLERLLGLKVEVESQVGTGTVFTVHVPLAASTPMAVAEQGEAALSLAGRRLLLVDDDPLVRDGLAREIADWGAEVTVVASAEAAMSAFAGPRTRPPEVAIVDRDLGGNCSGPELLHQLSARFATPIRAVIVTGATHPDALAELRQSGYTWMTKPLNVGALKRRVAEVLAEAAPVPPTG